LERYPSVNTQDRIANYLAQSGRKSLTPRQRRRVMHKDPHAVISDAVAQPKGSKEKGAKGKAKS
jgi:hypothetical protein